MMVRTNNVRGFMERISPWLEQRNAGTVRRFSIYIRDTAELISFEFSRLGLTLGNNSSGERLEFSLRELTSIVFGAHSERPVNTPDMLGDLFPFYFPIWQLDHS
jgi:hypothetical protein